MYHRSTNPDAPSVQYVTPNCTHVELKNLFFCETTDVLLSNGELIEEIDSYYCSNCLENLPTRDAVQNKMRCPKCADCPRCFDALLVNQSTDVDLGVVYNFSCSSCRWSGGTVCGKPDKLMTQLLSQETSATAKEEFDLHLEAYKKNAQKALGIRPGSYGFSSSFGGSGYGGSGYGNSSTTLIPTGPLPENLKRAGRPWGIPDAEKHQASRLEQGRWLQPATAATAAAGGSGGIGGGGSSSSSSNVPKSKSISRSGTKSLNFGNNANNPNDSIKMSQFCSSRNLDVKDLLAEFNIFVDDHGEIPSAVTEPTLPPIPNNDQAFYPKDPDSELFKSGSWIFGLGMNKGYGITAAAVGVEGRKSVFSNQYGGGNSATALPAGGIFACPKSLGEEWPAAGREGQPVPTRILETGSLQFKDGPCLDQVVVRVPAPPPTTDAITSLTRPSVLGEKKAPEEQAAPAYYRHPAQFLQDTKQRFHHPSELASLDHRLQQLGTPHSAPLSVLHANIPTSTELIPLRKPLLCKRSKRSVYSNRLVLKPQIHPCSIPPYQKEAVAVGFVPKLAFSLTKTPNLAELRATILENTSGVLGSGKNRDRELPENGATSLFLVLENPRQDTEISVDLMEMDPEFTVTDADLKIKKRKEDIANALKDKEGKSGMEGKELKRKGTRVKEEVEGGDQEILGGASAVAVSADLGADDDGLGAEAVDTAEQQKSADDPNTDPNTANAADDPNTNLLPLFTPAFHAASTHEHLSDLCPNQTSIVNRAIIRSYQQHFLEHKSLVKQDAKAPVSSNATASLSDSHAKRDENAQQNADRLASVFQPHILDLPTLEIVLGVQTGTLQGGAVILKDLSIPAAADDHTGGGVAGVTKDESDGAFVVQRKGEKVLLEIPVRVKKDSFEGVKKGEEGMVLYLKMRCSYEDGNNVKHSIMGVVRLGL